MGMLENDWLEAVGEEFKKPYYAKLYKFVKLPGPHLRRLLSMLL